ncbi:putative ankyrin repeat-containing domain-containing protein [Helianthus annuus]|nr:putative ankyrin repeat-containing domain-containing protein [Helianthus annuus]
MDANVVALSPPAHGLTPLHLAAKGDHIKVMDELLERMPILMLGPKALVVQLLRVA